MNHSFSLRRKDETTSQQFWFHQLDNKADDGSHEFVRVQIIFTTVPRFTSIDKRHRQSKGSPKFFFFFCTYLP